MEGPSFVINSQTVATAKPSFYNLESLSPSLVLLLHESGNGALIAKFITREEFYFEREFTQ